MRRREFLLGSAALGGSAPAGGQFLRIRGGRLDGPGRRRQARSSGQGTHPGRRGELTEGATVIDFAGPWEVFQDAGAGAMDERAFRLYTVGDSTRPIRGSAGLQLVPDYTFENAPQPKVIVVGAQRGGDGCSRWLRRASAEADLTMSVCTGAFQLARAGLLSGKAGHDAPRLARQARQDVPGHRGSPRPALRRGEPRRSRRREGSRRGSIWRCASSSDTSGRLAAERTATYMEYQSRSWIV